MTRRFGTEVLVGVLLPGCSVRWFCGGCWLIGLVQEVSCRCLWILLVRILLTGMT